MSAPSELLQSLERFLAPARTQGLELSPYAAGKVLDLMLMIAKQAQADEQRLRLLQAPPASPWLH